jgi:hypothetical protein
MSLINCCCACAAAIETVNDQLKNIFDLEHSRYRSLFNYLANIIACLVAYSYQDKKPALQLRESELLPFLQET